MLEQRESHARMETEARASCRPVLSSTRCALEMQSQILRGFIPCGARRSPSCRWRGNSMSPAPSRQGGDRAAGTPRTAQAHSRNKTAARVLPLLDAADVADLYLSRGVIQARRSALARLTRRGASPERPTHWTASALRFAKRRQKLTELVMESDIEEFHRCVGCRVAKPETSPFHEVVIGEGAPVHGAGSGAIILLHPQVIADEHAQILAMIDARDTDRAAAGDGCAPLQRALGKLVHVPPGGAVRG